MTGYRCFVTQSLGVEHSPKGATVTPECTSYQTRSKHSRVGQLVPLTACGGDERSPCMGSFKKSKQKSPPKGEGSSFMVDATLMETSPSPTTQENPRSSKVNFGNRDSEGGRVKFGNGAMDQPRKEASRRHETDFKSADAGYFRVENAVEENTLNALQARVLVHENAALIAKNYSSAFNGNRHMTNQNTEDLFSNRLAILDIMCVDAGDDLCKRAYVEAMRHREKLAFLKHRVLLNQQVLELTLAMTEVNSKLIEVNERVMETNEGIVHFNAQYISQNSAWIAKGLDLDSVTPANVAGLQKENVSLTRKMGVRAGDNTETLVECLHEAESNRDNILANEQDIYARREKIFNNRKELLTNTETIKKLMGLKSLMGSSAPKGSLDLAQAVEATLVKSLLGDSTPQDHKINLWQALEHAMKAALGCLPPQAAPAAPPPVISASTTSASEITPGTIKAIADHRVKLFSLEALVIENAMSAYHARSLIQENARLIAKIYSAAFSGNRQLTSHNTEDLFRNRLAILRSMALKARQAEDSLKQEYVQALSIKEKLTFLEHKATLNHQVLDLTLKMAEANAKGIDVNSRVMETNEEIVLFNAQYIASNRQWLQSGLDAVNGATPERVIELAKANQEAMAQMVTLTGKDKQKVTACLLAAKENHQSIMMNAMAVQERRKNIEANRASIQANQQAVANLLASAASAE